MKRSDLNRKFKQASFNKELEEKILYIESILKEHIQLLLKDYKSALLKNNLDLTGDVNIEGKVPFKPSYNSSVVIGILENNGELLDLLSITIWECDRNFLGISTSKKIPGSKIIGELLDETIEEVKEEIKEYLDDFLNE
ncbi:hypothetical protein [Niallia sp. 03133]|uniref:hypothetical protein n=1 Tax=Niallia sp. 03133 TaxID=3458060 RepID=UPI004044DEB1